MIPLHNVLASWDESATSLKAGRGNKNIYEYNLNLLGLVFHASRHKNGRKILSTVFGLSDSSISVIEQHSFEELRHLASEVLLIFVLAIDERQVLKALEADYDERLYLDTHVKVEEFDAAYWLLLNREAVIDPLHASVVFGTSIELAKAVANASDTQLRALRTPEPLRFRLRFNERQIQASLSQDSAGLSYLQRIQQSFN